MRAGDSEEQLVQQAIQCLQRGYFQGALDRYARLERLNPARHSAAHIIWLARAYLPGSTISARRLHDAAKTALRLSGGQGLAEVAVLYLRSGDAERCLRLLDAVLETARRQHGVLVTWHPTSVLELASFAATKLRDKRRAVELVNVALGHRAVYTSLADVQRLAELLVATEAPLALWADWCVTFVLHIHFATARPRAFAGNHDSNGEQWAIEEDRASERVLRGVFETGPPGLRDVLEAISPHLAAAPLADVLRATFQNYGPLASQAPPAEPLWWHPDCLRFRYFWYDLVLDHEQTMLVNGEWAIFNTPTADYSMALAQWWRVVESILKRSVAGELSKLFRQHPEWIAWDRDNLSDAQQKKEEVFLRKLADPQRAQQMTLADLLLVLKKCLADSIASTRTGSRLRLEASRYFGKHGEQLRPLIEATWLRPVHLTEDNITWFRNRASHDASIDSRDAFVGRALARRVLDTFFAPVLRRWGFIPRIET